MNNTRKFTAVLISIFCIGNVVFSQEKVSAEALLKDFIDDFMMNDVFPENPLEFGIIIHGSEGGEWKIRIDENKKINLEKGLPEKPTFIITSDLKTLLKVSQGEMNALTAAGKARASDKTPMDLEFQEGYSPSMEYLRGVILPFYFHFFSRGAPEIIPFGESYSRNIHGANAVALYYDLGLRTAWFQIKKRMFINKDIHDATNPFPSLFIFTKGNGKGRIGDKILDIQEGRAIFIPPGVIHQFWTEDENTLEIILIMFGDGA